MSKQDILEMNVLDYEMAVQYCWETYTERRVLYSHAQLFKEQSGQGSGQGFNIDFSGINPVLKALKKKRKPPKKFLESLRKDG